jgi:hypothetical protein
MSINKYSKLNEKQKENYSLTLSRPGTLKRPASASTSTVSSYKASKSESASSSTTTEHPFSFFAGATITGGTIHINITPPATIPTQSMQASMQTVHCQVASSSQVATDM